MTYFLKNSLYYKISSKFVKNMKLKQEIKQGFDTAAAMLNNV